MNTKQLLEEAVSLSKRLCDMTWAETMSGNREKYEKVRRAYDRSLDRAIRREELHERNQAASDSSG